jgi:tetratricopeptide (TPR) repeat protein
MAANISLCMIVKNEEESLATCLRSVADLVNEIIVVDTGSSDQTKGIAARFGARVHDFAWVNDFSAARNESLRHAGGEWIVWFDADESLDEANRQRLHALFTRLPDSNVAYVMTQMCLREASLHGLSGYADRLVEQVRLFRNHREIRWQHRVYEQILPGVRRTGGELTKTDIVIQHPGYSDPDLHRRKIERNLALAELEHLEHPEDAYVLYSLGVFLQRLGRTAESLRYLQPCVEKITPTANYAAKAYALLTQGYMQTGNSSMAMAACRAGRRLVPNDPELLAQEGILLRSAGDLRGAEACFTRLIEPEATALSPDRAGWVRHNLAQLYRQTGRGVQAAEQWRAALALQPTFVLGWLELGELYISMKRWDDLDQVVAQLQKDASQIENAVVLRARGMMMRSKYTAARQILEEAIRRSPQSLRPRQALSHVLLFENKDPAAAEQALREVLRLDPSDAQAKQNLAVLLRNGSPSTQAADLSLAR